MKKVFTLFACITFAAIGFAQDSTGVHTPPVCADTWHAVLYDYLDDWVLHQKSAYDRLYHFDSDTIIGEYTYRKLMCNNNLCGALRQTDDGMKVYYYDLSTSVQNPFRHTDCLLYDFSANVGDTIKDAYFWLYDMHIYIDFMGEPESIGWLVTDKQTIDGRIHMTVARCYDDSTTNELPSYSQPRYYTHWIQGIGTPNVIWPVDYSPGGVSVLYTLCAMHGDETLYSYDLESLGIENNCTEWHFTALDDIPADNSRNRKFLRNGHIYIETPLGTFDARGRKAE